MFTSAVLSSMPKSNTYSEALVEAFALTNLLLYKLTVSAELLYNSR